MLILRVPKAQVFPPILLLAAALFVAGLVSCRSQRDSAPRDLNDLDRRVALEIAHARIEGDAVHAKRERVLRAEAAQLQAEKAINAGDFDRARAALRRAEIELLGSRSDSPN